jgi:hypothetical protein
MEILTANDLNPEGAYALRLTNQGSSSTPAFTETGLAFNVALGGERVPIRISMLLGFTQNMIR